MFTRLLVAWVVKTVNWPQARAPPAAQALHRWAPAWELSRDVCFESWAKSEERGGGGGVNQLESVCATTMDGVGGRLRLGA